MGRSRDCTKGRPTGGTGPGSDARRLLRTPTDPDPPSPRFPPRVLNLRDVRLRENGVTPLAAALAGGALSELQRLDLSANPLGDAGLRDLAAAMIVGAFKGAVSLRELGLAQVGR
jgi:hypothetical protein